MRVFILTLDSLSPLALLAAEQNPWICAPCSACSSRAPQAQAPGQAGPQADIHFCFCEEELGMQLGWTNIQIAPSSFGCALWVGPGAQWWCMQCVFLFQAVLIKAGVRVFMLSACFYMGV